jgi:hypothetical protein
LCPSIFPHSHSNASEPNPCCLCRIWGVCTICLLRDEGGDGVPVKVHMWWRVGIGSAPQNPGK